MGRIRPADDPHNRRPFHGAKAALFIGRRLVLLRRDDRPDIPWPGRLDLPGGGREGTETGWQTICRETREELGVDLGPAQRLWARRYPPDSEPQSQSWFFVLGLPGAAEASIVLGDEGQGWQLLTPRAYLARTDAIPRQQSRVADWMALEKMALAPFPGTRAEPSNL